MDDSVCMLGPSAIHARLLLAFDCFLVCSCPHDEAPELVNPLLFKFLKQVNDVPREAETATTTEVE
jgi:hypothetical protein